LALAVATFRTAANDPVRADDRDRGQAGNRSADLQGALGEVVAAIHAERSVGRANVLHDIGDFSGPVDNVDLRIFDHGSEHRVEVKCLIWDWSRKLMLINERAHQRSVRRGATGYFPVLTCPGGDIAVVGPIFDPSDLDDPSIWTLRNLPGRYDPAYTMDLRKFCAKYIGRDWDFLCNRYISGHEWSAVCAVDFDRWRLNLNCVNQAVMRVLQTPSLDIEATAEAVVHLIDRRHV
jgi:hypothetical protein